MMALSEIRGPVAYRDSCERLHLASVAAVKYSDKHGIEVIVKIFESSDPRALGKLVLVDEADLYPRAVFDAEQLGQVAS